MAAVQIPWAPGAKYVKVTCRLGEPRPDNTDLDTNPDLMTQAGTVSLTCNVNRIRYTEQDGRQRMLSMNTWDFMIRASDGELVSADGSQIGVYVLSGLSDGMDPRGFTWTAVVTPEVGNSWTATIPANAVGSFDLPSGANQTEQAQPISGIDARVAALELASGNLLDAATNAGAAANSAAEALAYKNAAASSAGQAATRVTEATAAKNAAATSASQAATALNDTNTVKHDVQVLEQTVEQNIANATALVLSQATDIKNAAAQEVADATASAIQQANIAKSDAEDAADRAAQSASDAIAVVGSVDQTKVLPVGGTTGQVMVKASNTDFDYEYVDIEIPQTGMQAWITRHSFLAPYDYMGTAASGSAENVAAWRITRTNINTMAKTIATNTAWSDRVSGSYN